MTRKESLNRFGAFAQRFPTPPWETTQVRSKVERGEDLGKAHQEEHWQIGSPVRQNALR